MHLRLLLGLLSVVWASDRELFQNVWTKDHFIDDASVPIICGHDGYYNGSFCQCKSDFYGNYCDQRSCNNFGVLGPVIPNFSDETSQCLCPPGFLGVNCEPVKCVGDRSGSFYEKPSEVAVSILVTYNDALVKTWNEAKESLFDVVCGFEGQYRIIAIPDAVFVDSKTNVADCKAAVQELLDLETFDQCKTACSPLDVENILTLLEKTPANSIAYIVTNVNVTNQSPELQEQVMATAIAKRIQVNVIVYQLVTPLTSVQFDSDPGLLWLKNIASSTLGNYVTAIDIDPFGSNATVVINQLTQLWKSGVGVAAALPNDKSIQIASSTDVFLAARVRLGQPDIVVVGATVDVIIDTGLWKFYKVTLASSPASPSVKNLPTGEVALLLTTSRLNVLSAFTSDVAVDAAFSTIDYGATYSLAMRVEQNIDQKLASTADLAVNTLLGLSSITLQTNRVDRPSCQFNYIGSNVTCVAPGYSILHVSSRSVYLSASFPVMCTSKLYEPKRSVKYSSAAHRHVGSILEAEGCVDVGTAPKETSDTGRSFAIISSAYINDSDSNTSTYDRLYRFPGSIFYQLIAYVKNGNINFKSYVARIGNQSLLMDTNRDKFLTKIMVNVLTAAEAQPVMQPLKESLQLVIESIEYYSDIFVVIDDKYDSYDLTDVEKLYFDISQKRAKLYVIVVQTRANLTDENYTRLTDLASRSGGVAFRVGSFDDSQAFFELYFGKSLVAADVVAKGVRTDTPQGIVIPNLLLSKGQTYYLLYTAIALHVGDVVPQAAVQVRNGSANLVQTIGDLQIFNVTVDSDGAYSLSIAAGSIVASINTVLLQSSSDFINLAFTDNLNKEYSMNAIQYGVPAIPVLHQANGFDTLSTFTILYIDGSPKTIFDSSEIVSRGCDNYFYDFTPNFIWTCSEPNGLYHVQVNGKVGSTDATRTFTFTCASEDESACLNGGSSNDDGGCDCAVGWQGTNCAIPVCQNGGSATLVNDCQCPPNYSGFFCHLPNSTLLCTNQPLSPDFRAELGSLIFVVDMSLLKADSLLNAATNLNFPGTQIVVVQYNDDNGPRVVLSTTNGQLLPDALKTTTTTDGKDPDSPYPAINKALDAQLTDRALIVLVAANAEFPIDQETVNRLSAQRAELRVFTTQDNIGPNVTLLSLLGNGVIFAYNDIADFQEYFNNYVRMMFPTENPQRILNAYASDAIGSKPVSVPALNTPYLLVAHVFNGAIADSTCSGTFATNNSVKKTTDGSDSHIQIYEMDDGGKCDLTFSQSVGKSGFYSIERLSYIQTAYGFNSDVFGFDESLSMGITTIPNALSLYSVDSPARNPNVDISQLPIVTLRPIYSNGTLGLPTLLASSLKPSNCFYTAYTRIEPCTADSLAYQARISALASDGVTQQQQQVTFACQQLTDSFDCNGHGKLNKSTSTCTCDADWNGLVCSEPVCYNEGVRDGSVCRCVPPYTGTNCEDGHSVVTTTPQPSTTTMPAIPRAVAFIVDSVGGDDDAYNASVTAISEYMKYYSLNTCSVMLVSNTKQTGTDFDFNTYDSLNDLKSALDNFWAFRDPDSATDLDTTFQLILDKSKTDKVGHSQTKNVFYVTQTGGKLTSTTNLDELKTSGFVISGIEVDPYLQPENRDVQADLKLISDDTTSTYLYFDATTYMIGKTGDGQPDYQFNTTSPRPLSCVYALQANIIVAPDYTKLPDEDVDTKKKLNDFLTLFPSDFNLISNDDTRCKTDVPRYYQKRSLLAGMAYYDDQAPMQPTFCPSFYTSLYRNNYVGEETKPDFSGQQLFFLSSWLTDYSCTCSRFANEDVQKYVLWIPRASVASGDVLKQLQSNYTNLVMPFFYTPTAGDLYYDLAASNGGGREAEDYILPQSDGPDVSAAQLVQRVWTLLCQLGGVIESPSTATPPCKPSCADI